MPLRHLLWAIATLLPLAGATGPAAAQSSGTTRIVVGFAPGGSVDSLARITADALQSATKNTVIVENKPGASGRLAVDVVKVAPGDGRTLLLVPQGPITMFPYVFKRLNYDPAKDFIPVTRIASGDFALSIGPMVPAKDLAGFRQWAETAGAKASFASPGAGTVPHFVGVMVARALGTPLTHVPYRGAAPAIADVAGGNVAAAVTPLTEAIELHKAGRVRVIATTGDKRSPFVEGVPTFKESGIDVYAPLWFALYAPAATPPDTVDGMRRALHQSLATPAVKERLAKLGLVAAPSSSAEQLMLQQRERALWEPVIKASGFTPED